MKKYSKHKWEHLIEHNDKEGPFPTFYCSRCGNFASGVATLQFSPTDPFNIGCEKLVMEVGR